MTRTTSFILIAVLFMQCNEASTSKGDAVNNIAKYAGEDKFHDLKSLAFTFNVQHDTSTSSRQWKWLIPENEVVFYEKSDSLKFKRYDTSSARLKELNAKFTNDEYWLLFPFHMKWDDGMKINDDGMAVGPVTGDSLHKFTVRYDNDRGFTPGDMYVVYSDPSNKILEWEFHKGGSAEPSLMTSWEDYEDFAGLKLSSNRTSKDGKLRIFFTDIVAR